MIYAIIYLVGLVIAAIVMPKIFPYKEDDWRIEYDGAMPITEEVWEGDNMVRVVLWPVIVAFVVVLSPIMLINGFCNWCGNKLSKGK